MERSKRDFRETQMRGRPYTFIISLYCTLMIWSAFVAIDRHAAATAAVTTASAGNP